MYTGGLGVSGKGHGLMLLPNSLCRQGLINSHGIMEAGNMPVGASRSHTLAKTQSTDDRTVFEHHTCMVMQAAVLLNTSLGR
jgi:hypothetical protein